jgi:hypothetical protein
LPVIEAMEIKLIMLVVFAVLFGIMFIIAGFRRMFGKSETSTRRESIFWGVVGVFIGCALISGFGRMIFGRRPNAVNDSDAPIVVPSPFIVSTTQK